MQRLAYLDWLRGLACLLMFQTHCYDAWLATTERGSLLFHWSQKLGTFPAPLFLFLAGVSFALVTTSLRAKGVGRAEVFRKTTVRGAEIFALALLFRVQEFLLVWPWAPWTDLFRVDILNLMGLSLVAMSALCYFAFSPRASVASGIVAMLAVILVTPMMWTAWRPRWLGWVAESYVNGVHIYAEPQPWLFPVFPWMGFALAGMVCGLLLVSPSTEKSGSGAGADMNAPALAGLRRHLPLVFGVSGGMVALAAWWLDRAPITIYPVYDFWHTSPNFFLIRLGFVLMILSGVYIWCRWGWGARGWSPFVELGRESLLVYWVHIQFVYGRFSILEKGAQDQMGATVGFLTITGAMILLAFARRKFTEARRKRAARSAA